jgi:CBS domain-containing protein
MGKVMTSTAKRPIVSVGKDATVLEALNIMIEARVGAAVVLDEGRPTGIFTERDVMMKVVVAGRNAATTRVVEVMTSPVQPIRYDAEVADALQLMVDRHFRHLPVVDADGKMLGMLSMRHAMRERIETLKDEVGSLEGYISSDGPGG